jgi:uncharacterized membrane protein
MRAGPEALKRLEQQLGRLLVTGVTASAVLLAAGVALVLGWPRAGAGYWLLTIGLVFLMATPMLRVVVSFAEYIKLKEWFFVATTLIVLLELTVTVLYALTR